MYSRSFERYNIIKDFSLPRSALVISDQIIEGNASFTSDLHNQSMNINSSILVNFTIFFVISTHDQTLCF